MSSQGKFVQSSLNMTAVALLQSWLLETHILTTLGSCMWSPDLGLHSRLGRIGHMSEFFIYLNFFHLATFYLPPTKQKKILLTIRRAHETKCVVGRVQTLAFLHKAKAFFPQEHISRERPPRL